MKLATVKTIFFKEMLDTLRDKRTLIAMVGIPIVLYPLLIIVGSQVALVQLSKIEETPSRVGVLADPPGDVERWVTTIDLIEVVTSEDPRADLELGEIEAIVVAEGDAQRILDEGGSVPIRIEYDVTESASREAVNRIESGLEKQRDAVLKARLKEKGLIESFARPLDVQRQNVAPPEKAASSVLGMILPMLMVMMLGVGAFYPAIDITAGEKERGTFETLLSTPTSKIELVAGKFLTVFVLCMFTGLLNLASMALTLLFQFSQLLSSVRTDGQPLDIELASIRPESAVIILLILIPLAFFISAVMMTVAVFAKNFKEAQNYVTPFFVAILIPATMSAIPGIELTRATQFLPIANVSLLFRDLMTGDATLDMVFLVFVSTAVYAVLALIVATWIFHREEVILSEDIGIQLTLDRTSFEPQDVPSPGATFGLFTVIMLLIFYAGTYVQSRDIHAGLAITEYAIILAPVLLFFWFVRINFRTALNLHLPKIGPSLGTLLIAPAWVVLILQIGLWHDAILPAPAEFQAFGEELFSIGDSTGGLLLLLFIVALSPAICEEALFRGAMLSGLRGRIPGWAIVLVVGVAFGLFHLSIYRFVVTGLTGMVLTYLALRSRSIFPACFAHFVLNASSILLATEYLPGRVVEYVNEHDIEQNGMPGPLLIGALVVFLMGVVVIEMSARSSDESRA